MGWITRMRVVFQISHARLIKNRAINFSLVMGKLGLTQVRKVSSYY